MPRSPAWAWRGAVASCRNRRPARGHRSTRVPGCGSSRSSYCPWPRVGCRRTTALDRSGRDSLQRLAFRCIARRRRGSPPLQSAARAGSSNLHGASAAANHAGNWVSQHPITEQHGGERHERVPSGPERSRVRGGPERSDRIPLG